MRHGANHCRTNQTKIKEQVDKLMAQNLNMTALPPQNTGPSALPSTMKTPFKKLQKSKEYEIWKN
eukprot:4799534-Ditylum_brightwellii.AAC.1